jgi:S1-C subfamily serine protease
MARSSNDFSPQYGSAWLVFTALLATGLVLAWRLWPTPAPGNDPAATSRPIAPAGPPTSEEQKRIEIFSKAKFSVVNITSAQLRRDNFTLNVQEVPKGTGTGFIWDEKGHVVTNYHVVEGADHVFVRLDDQTISRVAPAQVRYDAANDLAVLLTDIPESKRKPIPLGESSKLQVGQTVLAIGNPFGLDHSLTSGIVSALGRDIRSEGGRVVRGLIQTDAPINPGNSGGPLLDSSGRLIGVTTAIISPSGGSSGVGFAIPVDLVNRVIPRLLKGAKESRPGVGIVEAPDQWAQQRGIDGVLIINVIPGSPAEKAQLHPTFRDEDGRLHLGDIIVGIDDHRIHSANELYSLLADHYKVGQEIAVHVQRDGEEQTAKLTLSADAR